MSNFEGLNFNTLTEWADHVRTTLQSRCLYSPLKGEYDVGHSRAVSDSVTPKFGKEQEGMNREIGSHEPKPPMGTKRGEMGDIPKRDNSLLENTYSVKYNNTYERGRDSVFNQKRGYINPENIKGDNLTTEEFRALQLKTNTNYQSNEYGKETMSSNDDVNFSNAIGSTLPLISGIGSAINLVDTIESRSDDTKMMKIANKMFLQHMMYNSVALTSAQNLPQLDLMNVFRGGDVLSLPVDYTITQYSDGFGKTWAGRLVTDLAKGALASSPFSGLLSKSPLSKSPTQDEILEHTGKKQISFLFHNLSKNIFIGNIDKFNTINKKNKIDVDLSITRDNKTTFISNTLTKEDSKSLIDANEKLTINYYNDINTGLYEYPSQDDIKSIFGETTKEKENFDVFNWIGEGNEDNDLVNDSIVWGRDGVTDETKKNLSNTRIVNTSELDDKSKKLTEFGVRTGLLAYTSELLNATNGNYVDITRQVFKDKLNGKQIIGYQGSPLLKKNDSEYAKQDKPTKQGGLRQHTVLSPYGLDKSKTIRYLGNKGYGGNENSVIYNSVLPKIHPTENDKGNYRNLMFSIENLAYNIRPLKKEGYGIVDDEYGTPIPLSEIGPSNGRIMWFPPYDIKINESINAKYESTVMVGRNEPLYNYMNSERSANLTFKLLVDHPEQLKNYTKGNGSDHKANHKNVAEFFAFGGDKIDKNIPLKNDTEEIEEPISPPSNSTNSSYDITISFPNNEPTTENVNTIFTKMFNLGYEISKDFDKEYLQYDIGIDENEERITKESFGLNKNIYFLPKGKLFINGNGKIMRNFSKSFKHDQYNVDSIGIRNTFDNSTNNLNFILSSFNDKNFIKTNKIIVKAGASLRGDKNVELGQRRVKATIHLIKERLRAMGIEPNDVTIIGLDSKGSEESNSKNTSLKYINTKEVKLDRIAIISFETKEDSNETPVAVNNTTVIDKSIDYKNQLKKDGLDSNFMKDRDEPYLENFKSITENFFYSAFHSQTPEDFHKRLTFLHQCTRQGSAKRLFQEDSPNNLTAKNSVFGRQPICVLRIGDFFYTKVIIETITIDYDEAPWDLNPEGFGLQPMIADVTIQMKVIGGQSLVGPIDVLQNAVSYNYYANSTFSKEGIYKLPSTIASLQQAFNSGTDNSQTNQHMEEMKQRNDRYNIDK